MAVDKNLFLYNLAAVAIMKNEGAYLKEWLDYHLLAGVDHFFIYDNESPDNQREVLQPYVDAGLVTYKFYPGKMRQFEAYNETVRRFKFFCRYLAFIDADEFILPKNNRSISEVADEILADNPQAAALAVNWHCFGSNNLDAADLSRGVLERFTRRAENGWHIPITEKFPNIGNSHIKTIANPRKINFFQSPHYPQYFTRNYAVNERGERVPAWRNLPVLAEKICINHYYTKSREEFVGKMNRGHPDTTKKLLSMQMFEFYDRNEIFDDEILKYRAARQNSLKNKLTPDMSAARQRLFDALIKNLAPTFAENIPAEFFDNKLETFLTCRAVAEYLRDTRLNDTAGNFFEEAALLAIFKSIQNSVRLADMSLLLRDLPNILPLKYPVVAEIRQSCMKIIPQMLDYFRANSYWRDFVETEYLANLLKTFEPETN